MTMPRKEAILQAAGHQFSHFGYRGASLREVAREAGTSLTLLAHHFGNKDQLLRAVVDTHRDLLDDRADAIDRLIAGGPGSFTPTDLVQAWVRAAFAIAAEPDGETYLRLLARLLDDPGEERVQAVRAPLDEAALRFITALQQCYPGASRHAAASACMFVSAAILQFLVGGRRLFRLAEAGSDDDLGGGDQARLTRFLVAGIDAALGDAPDAPAGASSAEGGADTPVRAPLAEAA
jgi:AcrR family transcriptional regulator